MNLQEMQQFLSTERHEWQVPAKVKDKVAKMVERYNRRAIKKGYDTSTLTFDEATQTLSGLFMPKKEKKSFFGQIAECGTNADLYSDFKHILDLCTAVCPHCHSLVAPSAKRCENCGEPLFKEPSADTEKAAPLPEGESQVTTLGHRKDRRRRDGSHRHWRDAQWNRDKVRARPRPSCHGRSRRGDLSR